MRTFLTALTCLMLCASTPVLAGDDSGARSTEIAFWQSIAESDNPDSFIAYLEQFPDGIFAVLARIKLKELGVVVIAPERTDTGADSSGYSEAVRNRLDVLKAIHDKGLITDEEYAQKRRDIERGSGHPASLKERLTTLKNLFDEGELTQSEYDTQRRAVLNDSKTVADTPESLDGVYKAVTACGDTIQMGVIGKNLEGWVWDSRTRRTGTFNSKLSNTGSFNITVSVHDGISSIKGGRKHLDVRGTLSRATLEECPGPFAFTKVE